jgi:hypothetical protein
MSTIAQNIEIIVNCNWLPRKHSVAVNMLLNKLPEKQIFYCTCIQIEDLRYNNYHL